MLELLLNILRDDDHYGVSETIDFAKGSREIPSGVKGAYKQLKRKKIWQKR